jgi:hypothetical protein
MREMLERTRELFGWLAIGLLLAAGPGALVGLIVGVIVGVATAPPADPSNFGIDAREAHAAVFAVAGAGIGFTVGLLAYVFWLGRLCRHLPQALTRQPIRPRRAHDRTTPLNLRHLPTPQAISLRLPHAGHHGPRPRRPRALPRITKGA